MTNIIVLGHRARYIIAGLMTAAVLAAVASVDSPTANANSGVSALTAIGQVTSTVSGAVSAGLAYPGQVAGNTVPTASKSLCTWVVTGAVFAAGYWFVARWAKAGAWFAGRWLGSNVLQEVLKFWSWGSVFAIVQRWIC